jgi:hypothetical protein
MYVLLKTKTHPKKFVFFPADVDWGTLISNVVWAFGGFDTMGVLAGEGSSLD